MAVTVDHWLTTERDRQGVGSLDSCELSWEDSSIDVRANHGLSAQLQRST